MQAEQRRPEVTLTASSLPRGVAPAPPRRRPVLLLLLPLLAVVLALTTGGSPPSGEPAAVRIDAQLLLLEERLSNSQTGILVLPVELRNRGNALEVQQVRPYGFPLRADPSVRAPQEVAAGERRRFVMILAPDCGLLDQGSTELFQASLLVRVTSGSVSGDLLLDLAESRLLRERVAGICA